MKSKKEYPILHFTSASEWEKWLAENHRVSEGVWLKYSKKGSLVPSVHYAEALDVALCYGWIDSQSKSFDDLSYLQKFTPRTKKSIWSKINTEHIARLTAEGRMQPAGLEQVAAAKQDGRWDRAYSSPGTMEMPTDFLQELAKHKKAQTFFNTLSKSNTYAIGWRLQTAKKPETRLRRMNTILEMLEKGEKFH